ncbi:hypothetical protein Lal_00001604 [Lupinus albus]|uniref:Putative neprosin n=1 Tax=Lupinus albus TaxID=3870 RepID=A0A6A5P6Q7_LUPAL|nr:putative neprosin [Lupinus albus]KAF1893167.1 hypothetical protein Lal_00001604 [Lupinus albus]
MRKRKVAILLLGALFISLNMKVEARELSSLEIQIDAKLKLLNKPAIKTIKSEDGDIIDCVDIYKQPAFDHPALKYHTIQEMPSILLENHDSSIKGNASKSKSVIFQKWQKSGNCPKGTIPIRRIQREDLLRVSSVERFGMKPPQPFQKSTNDHNNHFLNLNSRAPQNRSAAYIATMGYNYIGAQADINVWNRNGCVKLPDDFTTAQIWLMTANGPHYFESIEAGWMVNPKFYGDNASRLFAYWTRDSHKSTGCFDLSCSGFVQTNNEVALGAAFQPVSSKNGTQYSLKFGLFLDTNTQNWWLKVKNTIPIGYWPAKILRNLRQSAIVVQWGGEVFSPNIEKKPHTGTVMGSGEFASGLWGNSCYIKNITIMDYSLQLKPPEYVVTVADEPYCYSSLYFRDAYFGGPIFYFGGPGRNPPFCP